MPDPARQLVSSPLASQSRIERHYVQIHPDRVAGSSVSVKLKLALSSAALLILLLACGQPSQPIHTPALETQIISLPTWKPTPTISATPISTVSLTPTSMSKGMPTPTGLLALRPSTILYPDSLDDPNLLFRDLILFTSRSSMPMPHVLTRYALTEAEQPFAFNTSQIWVFSPDGQSAGLITDPDADLYNGDRIAIHFSTDLQEKHLYASGQIDLYADQFQKVPLPDLCNDPTTQCDGFRFSPDGKYLGFYFGPEECGRGMMILDARTGAIVHMEEAGGHRFDFLSEGKIWLASGHCQGGGVMILDPSRRLYNSAGPEPVSGFIRTSADGAAFVINAHDYQGMESTITAYDLHANQVFLSDRGVVENVVWTADGSHFLYERAAVTRSAEGPVSFGPMEILIAPRNARPRSLVSDPRYDFHLCQDRLGEGCEWVGDWIQVRRFAKRLVQINPDVLDFCLLYGMDCPGETTALALNWRTGEVVLWDQAPLPPPTETPAPTPEHLTGPDLSQLPVYVDPEGRYAYYVGHNRNSLWLVSKEGDPILWVQDGENFVYLP